jgi:hypothetical protein
MEINYDLIIKYLVTKKNIFPSKKHILIYNDLFPEKFKDLLGQNKFYRYGINQNKYSFYNSILTLLNINFITYNSEEEDNEINNFIKLTGNTDENYITNLSQLLNLNFIIFDFKDENIKIVYSGEFCNPYIPSLLIANYEHYFEPMIYETENKKIFSYNDNFIKKIYNSDLIIYNNINKIYKLEDNLEIITESFNDKIIDTNIPFIKTENSDLTEELLTKMTKKKLETYLDNKNIKVNINKITKKEIINLILN